jgi:RNA polymerase sigma-70 factor (ECF subfamily)
VATYFGNYERAANWHLRPAWLDGREVLAVVPEAHTTGPHYFIELGWSGDRVIAIRDFRHVPYIAQDKPFELAESATHRSSPP